MRNRRTSNTNVVGTTTVIPKVILKVIPKVILKVLPKVLLKIAGVGKLSL